MFFDQILNAYSWNSKPYKEKFLCNIMDQIIWRKLTYIIVNLMTSFKRTSYIVVHCITRDVVM